MRDGVIISESPHVRHCEPNQVPRMNGHIVARVQNDETGDYRNFPKETAEANAAFIVRACNSHAELLEALEMLAYYSDLPDDTELVGEMRAVYLEQARAAIAKAKGGA